MRGHRHPRRAAGAAAARRRSAGDAGQARAHRFRRGVPARLRAGPRVSALLARGRRGAAGGDPRPGDRRRQLVLLGDAAAAAGAARRDVRGLCLLPRHRRHRRQRRSGARPSSPRWRNGATRWRRSSPAPGPAAGAGSGAGGRGIPTAAGGFPRPRRRHGDGCARTDPGAEPRHARPLLRPRGERGRPPVGAHLRRCLARRGSRRAFSRPRLAAHQHPARSRRGCRPRPALSAARNRWSGTGSSISRRNGC